MREFSEAMYSLRCFSACSSLRSTKMTDEALARDADPSFSLLGDSPLGLFISYKLPVILSRFCAYKRMFSDLY